MRLPAKLLGFKSFDVVDAVKTLLVARKSTLAVEIPRTEETGKTESYGMDVLQEMPGVACTPVDF